MSQATLFGPPPERRRSTPDLVCQHCGGPRFWFDLDAWRWQCWACVPPAPKAYATGWLRMKDMLLVATEDAGKLVLMPWHWLRMKDMLLVATARDDGSHQVDIVPRPVLEAR